MRLILASASPRRAEVLRDANIAFESLPVSIDETRWHNEAPAHLVRRLAKAKAAAVADRVSGAAIVLGADTEVIVDGDVLGKPAAVLDAREMLRRLSGRTHEVITGLELIRLPDRTTRSEQEISRVTFAPLSDAEIDTYVASGEPFDKAGGYAIQGRAGRFVTRVEGCYFNVVGLPLSRLYRTLRELGWSPD
ncbi:MAG: septum formation inhibitor Maf [Acidobacteria bacterium]|nr:septum formation inhibitor Maf [Acidobacteriota bacterium]